MSKKILKKPLKAALKRSKIWLENGWDDCSRKFAHEQCNYKALDTVYENPLKAIEDETF